MKVKDGNKQNINPKTAPKKIFTKTKSVSLKDNNPSLENDYDFPNSLTPELDELMQKGKKRFFGGCG